MVIFLVVSELEFVILEFMGFGVNNLTAVKRVHLSHGPHPRLWKASWECNGKKRKGPVAEPWPTTDVRAQDLRSELEAPSSHLPSSEWASQSTHYAPLLSCKPVNMEGNEDQGGQCLCCYK